MQRSIGVDIHWGLRKSWRAERLLRRVALHVATAEGFRTGTLSIMVCGARRMATLHKQFLGIAGPTDVLTFDLETDNRRKHIEGEVIVCADVAQRRAADKGLRAASHELALYVAHGVLHLAGYNDHRPADFRRMHAREDELLTELGLGAVFSKSG